MGLIEEILKNKEEIIVKLISLMEGKETKARINLDDVEFNIGSTKIMLSGAVDIDVIPQKKKKK